jgi:hypothetical protein
MARWRLPLLLAALVGLLVYVWATDGPGPAWGQSRFWSLMWESAIIVGIATIVVGAWRDWRSDGRGA